MSTYKNKKLQPLAGSLFKFLRNVGIEEKVKEYEAIGRWPAIVGNKIAEVTTAERVSDGILFVKVKNSVWRNELMYMKSDILASMDETIGKNVIKDIRYI